MTGETHHKRREVAKDRSAGELDVSQRLSRDSADRDQFRRRSNREQLRAKEEPELLGARSWSNISESGQKFQASAAVVLGASCELSNSGLDSGTSVA